MPGLKTRFMVGRARRLVAWRPALPASALVLLGACAVSPPPDVTTSRAYPGLDPAAVRERTVAAFRASDLDVTANDPATGVITGVGSFEDRNWAQCAKPRMLVEDTKGRHRLVDAPEKAHEIELQASVSDGPQGATLTLDPAFTVTPGHRMATSPNCDTTGALERKILDAVAKP